MIRPKLKPEVLGEVVTLRNRALADQDSATSQVVDETAMRGLRKLCARVGAYPQPKADTHFLALPREPATTEGRL